MKLTKRNYFSRKANEAYMSVSQFKAFEKCQNAALAEVQGKYQREETTALLVGSFVDAYFEGEKEMVKFINSHPEVFLKGTTIFKAPFQQANEIIKRIEKDKLFMEYISGKQQVIMTGEICGVPVKIMMDSYHPDKMIVDRKIIKNFAPIYDEEKGHHVPWFEYWGYDIQGAVYQEIVRQNTGKKLPFFLAPATKEKVTDIDILQINQTQLDSVLDRVQRDIVMYDAIKKGVIEPDRCEFCEYCKNTKVLTAPTDSEEFYF